MRNNLKKIFLLISDLHQRDASAFISEFEALGGRIDGIVYVNNQSTFRKIFRDMGHFNDFMRALHKICSRIYAHIRHLNTLENLERSWSIRGENSWDLLPPGVNLKQYSKNNHIRFHRINKICPSTIDKIRGKEPAIFVFYSGGILKGPVLDTTSNEFIISHMGSVPRYRGMNVVEWAYLENHPLEVSVMVIDSGIDSGDILDKYPIDIKNAQTIAGLRKSGYETGVKATARAILDYSQGKLERKSQQGSARYYYRMHDDLREKILQKLKQQAPNSSPQMVSAVRIE